MTKGADEERCRDRLDPSPAPKGVTRSRTGKFVIFRKRRMALSPGGRLGAINGYDLTGEPSRATVAGHNRKQRSRMSATPAVNAGFAAESVDERSQSLSERRGLQSRSFRSRDRTDAAGAQGLCDVNVDPYSCSSILVWSGDCPWP
jgi:hypothetical protein